MKTRNYDVFVWDCHNACTVIVKTVRYESEAQALVIDLCNLGIEACYGIRPDRIVKGRCIYED